MQPYETNLQDKGLFTFYREQEEAEETLKKVNIKNLSKLLSKPIKSINPNSQEKKKMFQQSNQFDFLYSQRKASKLQQILQEKSQTLTKKKQKLKKNVFLLETKPTSNQSIYQIQEQISDQNCLHYQNMHDYHDHQTSSFSKYLSEFDIIKAKKQAIDHRPSLTLLYQSMKLHPSYKKCPKSNHDFDNQTKKIATHFKKLALEPQQFLGSLELSKNFISAKIEKKQKAGLKSYRKEKYKALAEKKMEGYRVSKNQTDHCVQQNSGVIDFTKKKTAQFISNDQSVSNEKLINLQKLACKAENIKNYAEIATITEKSLIQSTGKKTPKVKFIFPQILNRSSNNNSATMSVQISKNKYYIIQPQKEQKMNFNKNQKSQTKLKKFKISYHSKHHTSNRYSENPQSGQARCNNINSAQSMQKAAIASIEKDKSNEFSVFKKNKIFCKREDLFGDHTKKGKRETFTINKQNQANIRGSLQQKKRKIIQDLFQKLTSMRVS